MSAFIPGLLTLQSPKYSSYSLYLRKYRLESLGYFLSSTKLGLEIEVCTTHFLIIRLKCTVLLIEKKKSHRIKVRHFTLHFRTLVTLLLKKSKVYKSSFL